MTGRSTNIDALALVRAIANHLEGWAGEPYRLADGTTIKHGANLVRARDRATLFVRIDDDRLDISATWPKSADGTENTPFGFRNWERRLATTCNAARPAKHIASQIARAILPKFDDAHAKSLATVRRIDSAEQDALAAAHRLAGPHGLRVEGRADRKSHNSNGNDARLLTEWGQLFGVVVKPASSDRDARVSIHWDDLHEETAARILAAFFAEPSAVPPPSSVQERESTEGRS